MKGFSPAGVAADQAVQLAAAQAAVDKHPQALFTDFQWFLYEAKDTVFFAAFSSVSVDEAALHNIVADMVALAPQLTHGFVGARPGQPLPLELIRSITSIEHVDGFDGYPDSWLGKSGDIFEIPDLPLFRVRAAVRRNGPDGEGRASLIQVRSSHALLEGADSALLTRSQSAARGVEGAGTRVGVLQKIATTVKAQALAWTYIVLGNLFAPPERPWDFRTIAISRHRLRRLANKFGVRQRSLYFALVTYVLHGEGHDSHGKRAVGAAYTLLGGSPSDLNDDFFRVRALQAKFYVKQDFGEFVRSIDETVARLEMKDITKFMALINLGFGAIRGLNRLWKGLPGKRFWRFNMGIDIALTLVPPHRTYGPMTHGFMEPIYCGAWHPGQNICTYCPGRDYVTMNFSMEQRHIAKVGRILPLLERLEAEASQADTPAKLNP